MSSTPLFFRAGDRQTDGTIPVFWRNGAVQPFKGVVHVSVEEGPHAKAIAEVVAILSLIKSGKVGTSLRNNRIHVSQAIIMELLDKGAPDSAIVPYGRSLYINVDPEKIVVDKKDWGRELPVNPERVSSASAEEVNWPAAECAFLGEPVGISRHAVERHMERFGTRDPWRAFMSITRTLASKAMRELTREEVARTNPKMRYDERTKVLLETRSDTAVVLVREDFGWAMTTIYRHSQEFVPTLVYGRVEYRRAT